KYKSALRQKLSNCLKYLSKMQARQLPNLWASPHGFLHRDRLMREAAQQASSHKPPMCVEELDSRLQTLREKLGAKLYLEEETELLDLEFHGDIQLDGYKIQKISYASAPGIRVTGSLYVPEGTGPFPAVLNMHGHWA